MTARYEPPEETLVLSDEEIHRRYQDTALTIFNEQQSKQVVNYLSFGPSRRTMEYSNYGNQPVIIRRPAGSFVARTNSMTSQIRRIYQKPRDSCAIN